MRTTLALILLATPSLAETPKVVTDFLPVAALTATVMGDLGTPQMLLPKGADVHDFQLRPSMARGLTDADLVVWMGPVLTPWLETSLKGLDVRADQLVLMDAPGTKVRPYSPDGQFGPDDELPEGGEATDPHMWLDPQNATLWLGLIAERLSRLDPDNAATYRANAEAGEARIAAMDAELKAELAPVASVPFAAFHNAYGYFAAHYGLHLAGAIRDGESATPGAAHLDTLHSEIAAGDAACVFPEANHDEALADQMIEGTKARLGPPLDPEGATLDESAGAYEALMRNLAKNIAACLKGA